MPIDMQKKFRERANRARRALLQEQKKCGFISDGSGKRYRVSVDFVLSGDLEKAEEFIRWFNEQFPDDVGEPAFLLYTAIIYFRLQEKKKARQYLLDTMLSNMYLIPILFDQPISELSMWHSSNWEGAEYVGEIAELLDEPSDEERVWFKAEFESPLFTKIRNRYIETYSALQDEREIVVRRRILDEWRAFESDVRINEI